MQQYIFLWSIENYKYCWHKNGEGQFSPKFTTKRLEGTAWNLQLYPRGKEDGDKGYVALFLNRISEDGGPDNAAVRYELSVLTEDGSSLSLKDDHAFKKGSGRGWKKFLKMDKILLQKRADYLPRDILTVRCKIWKGEEKNVRNIGQYSARTRIKVERISFLHEAERFSTLQPNAKQTIEIQSHSGQERYISSSLYCTDCSCCEEKIVVEILPSETTRVLLKCELFLLDVAGNAIECGKADNRYDTEGKTIRTLPLSLTRAVVMSRKSEFLPDDKLSLLCRCTFSAALEFESIEETVHEMPLCVQQKFVDFPAENDSKIPEKNSSYSGGLEDIKALYINKSLTDVQLKTKTKSFPAHKVVLCARSPVFMRMMSSDMREKNTDCIEVDDLEEDVVQQFLSFLYSDTVENLEWKLATRLYYASDKYVVSKLKKVCSSFLLANLTPDNAGDLLLLADTHSDTDLKKLVEDFILKNEEQVFGSEQWERLMETNPVLVMKAMHLKYKRKKEVN